MNEKPDQRPPTLQDIEMFEDISYLNGGLFRLSLGNGRFDEEDFDVRNSVLKSIIALLERYSFSGGGSPTLT